MENRADASDVSDPSRIEIDEALDRLLEGEGLASSDRLKDFLRYVVARSVEAPGQKIPAKAIAHDVYHRPS